MTEEKTKNEKNQLGEDIHQEEIAKLHKKFRIFRALAIVLGIGIVANELYHCREASALKKENQLLGDRVKLLGNQLNEAWYQVGKASQIGKKLN